MWQLAAIRYDQLSVVSQKWCLSSFTFYIISTVSFSLINLGQSLFNRFQLLMNTYLHISHFHLTTAPDTGCRQTALHLHYYCMQYQLELDGGINQFITDYCVCVCLNCTSSNIYHYHYHSVSLFRLSPSI